MSVSTHGKEIVALLAQQPQGLSMVELIAAMAQQFPHGVFNTCKVKGMNSAEIIAAMITKGRIQQQGDLLLAASSGCGCNHK